MPAKEKPVTTLREAYAEACLQLKNAGHTQEAAGREAMELLAFYRGESGLKLLLSLDAAMDPGGAERYRQAVARLAKDEPKAYIIGSQEFYGYDFSVRPGLLIPRRDSEILVGQALSRLAPETGGRVLELGCGSGALIAALALARPDIRGLAVDIDPLAVETAKENIARHGLSGRIQVLRGSWFEPVDQREKFSLILSNPPYITTAEMAELPESVKKEPERALWGGDDGLDCYRQILPAAFAALEAGGWCLVEIGWKQGPAVKAMLETAGFSGAAVYQDEGGRDRVAAGFKKISDAMETIIPEAIATRRWRIESPGDPRIAEAGRIIREGGLVAFPTETVYGLGANGLDGEAVAGIYQAKGRPADNPLILHVASVAEAQGLALSWSDKAGRLADSFWPGPLTMIVPAAGCIPRIVTAGLDTVAIRCPAEPVALALIKAAGVPVAAPSANISGRPSPTRADHVMEDLSGKIHIVIDGGPCQVGLESTILDLTVEPPQILRPGAVTREALIRVIGEVRKEGEGFEEGEDKPSAPPPKAPGMKYRHYAPKAPAAILLGEPSALAVYVGEAVARIKETNLGDIPGRKTALLLCQETWHILENNGLEPEKDGRFYCRDMGSRDRPGEMGSRLYDALRACDSEGAGFIYVEACSAEGQGAAVMNRLRKAAGNRIIRLPNGWHD